MKIPKFDTDYLEGITAPYIDWVAGGNFDGYLIQKKLIFRNQNNKVEFHTTVIHAWNYDDDVSDSLLIGTYQQTEKNTLTLIFEDFEMRGKILGEKEELIAFSVWGENRTTNINEVYKRKE